MAGEEKPLAGKRGNRTGCGSFGLSLILAKREGRLQGRRNGQGEKVPAASKGGGGHRGKGF